MENNLQWELESKEKIINNLINEINTLKNKEQKIVQFNEEIRKENKKTNNFSKNILPIRKKINSEYKKSILNKEENDINLEFKEKINYQKTPNKELNILLEILWIYKELPISKDIQILIESKIKKFFDKIKENFKLCEDFDKKLDNIILFIIENNKDKNYHEIISNQEKILESDKQLIQNLKQKNKNWLENVSNQTIENNKWVSQNISLVNNIKRLEIDIDIINEKLQQKDINLNLINNEGEIPNQDKSIVFEAKYKLKLMGFKKLQDLNNSQIIEINSLNDKIIYWENNINKISEINKNYITQIIKKETYINDINWKYDDNLKKLLNYFDTKINQNQNNNNRKSNSSKFSIESHNFNLNDLSFTKLSTFPVNDTKKLSTHKKSKFVNNNKNDNENYNDNYINNEIDTDNSYIDE